MVTEPTFATMNGLFKQVFTEQIQPLDYAGMERRRARRMRYLERRSRIRFVIGLFAALTFEQRAVLWDAANS